MTREAADALAAAATSEVSRLTDEHGIAREVAAASDAVMEEDARRTSVLLTERDAALAIATAEVTRLTEVWSGRYRSPRHRHAFRSLMY